MKRSLGLCQLCMDRGITRAAAVVDHIVPLAKGGSDEDANTRNLCKQCHNDVTAEQFGHRKKIAVGSDGWPK